MGHTITLGEHGRGYLSTPELGAGPGLVVVEEHWGLGPHIEDVCDRFASEGFTALAPEVVSGATGQELDEAGKLMMALNLGQAAADMGAAIDHLGASGAVRGDGVGSVGFGMGGALALVLASQRPDDVRACTTFYGLIPWESAQPDWSRLRAPVQGHFAEHDELFPPEKMKALQAALAGEGVDVDFHVYPGVDHAFFNRARPDVFDEGAASLAWTRCLEFLRAKLG